MAQLEDSFKRRFFYLRLSVTDACNFRCIYCLPQGYHRRQEEESLLNLSEIKNLVSAFAEMGISKLRLTGGEPTLRRDLLEILEQVGSISGIQKLALSTNGYRLRHLAPFLKEAGLYSVNVSVDSLNPLRFFKITGSNRLGEILNGIGKAIEVGIPSVKINAVLLGPETLDELPLFLQWIRDKPVTVRFIELMPTGLNFSSFQKHHIKSEFLRPQLEEMGWVVKPRAFDDGPACEFQHPDFQGKIGIIAPFSPNFCKTCNRLRVTSRGALQLCLFAEGGHSLRHLLKDESQRNELKVYLTSLLQKKEVSHYLPEGRFGKNQTFSAVGG